MADIKTEIFISTYNYRLYNYNIGDIVIHDGIKYKIKDFDSYYRISNIGIYIPFVLIEILDPKQVKKGKVIKACNVLIIDLKKEDGTEYSYKKEKSIIREKIQSFNVDEFKDIYRIGMYFKKNQDSEENYLRYETPFSIAYITDLNIFSDWTEHDFKQYRLDRKDESWEEYESWFYTKIEDGVNRWL